MIPCDEKCQLYYRCELRGLRKRCLFDMGINVKDKEDDEFLEKITY